MEEQTSMPLWKLLHVPAPKGALRYIEFIPLILFIILGVYLTRPKEDTVKAPEFRPIELKQLRLIYNGPFLVGQSIAIENGLCNRSDMDLSLDLTLGFQRGAGDPVLDPQRRILFDTLSYPIRSKACIGGSNDFGPRLVKIPEDMLPGTWRLYAIVIARGKSSLEMQRETVISQDFEIRPRIQ